MKCKCACGEIIDSEKWGDKFKNFTEGMVALSEHFSHGGFTEVKEKSKIYIFVNEINSIGVFPVALAEDGTCLAGHCCSNEGFIKHDMGITSDWKHEHYKKHYPDGYELVLCDFKDIPQEVISRVKKDVK